MPYMLKRMFLISLLFFGGFVRGDKGGGGEVALTHADAAVILAKYTGFFDRYVDDSADLNECVAFLNGIGIYFGLMEVVNNSEFTIEDCARSMGQIELILSGEATLYRGRINLPKGIESWKDFCIMNEVKYAEGHQAMLDLLEQAYTRAR